MHFCLPVLDLLELFIDKQQLGLPLHFCLPVLLELFIDKQRNAVGKGADIKATQLWNGKYHAIDDVTETRPFFSSDLRTRPAKTVLLGGQTTYIRMH